MKIVILGYTGLIGNSIFSELALDTSINLVCVGRKIKKKPYKSPRIIYCKWDFDKFTSSNLLFLKNANIIINCIGKIENKENNLEKVNVTYLKKLLDYINDNKLKLRFIHLSSVSVYGGAKYYIGKNKIFSENSLYKVRDLYSRTKLKGDLLIKNNWKYHFNNDFSFTILRISNVFGGNKKTNLFRFLIFSLRFKFWIRSFDDVMFNFVNLEDVTQAVILVVNNLNKSKNKVYIVSDDCKQYEVYKNYQNLKKEKIFKLNIPISIIKFLIDFFPLPRKVVNFFLVISSRVSYNNKKIKKELKFNPSFSIDKSINILVDEKKK